MTDDQIAAIVCLLLLGTYWNAKKSCEALTGETCLIELNVVPMTINERIISNAE